MNKRSYNAPAIASFEPNLFQLFGVDGPALGFRGADDSSPAPAPSVEDPKPLSRAARRRRELHEADAAQARKDEAAFYENLAFHKARGIEMKFDAVHS